MCEAHNARGPETRREAFFFRRIAFFVEIIFDLDVDSVTSTLEASLVAHAQNAHLLFSYFDPTTLQPEIRRGGAPVQTASWGCTRCARGSRVTSSRYLHVLFYFLFLLFQFAADTHSIPSSDFFEKKNR